MSCINKAGTLCLVLVSLLALPACEVTTNQEPSTPSPASMETNTGNDNSPLIYSERRAACRHRSPLRHAFFGDLHVHTGLSFDAYQQEVRTRPKDAYDFAKGKAISFHDKKIKIDRPLDFTAVTDHAEFLGDLQRCTSKTDPMHDTDTCTNVRLGSGAAFEILENSYRNETSGSQVERVTRALQVLFKSEDPEWNRELCGPHGEACLAASQLGWQEIVAAADAAYDRSADCSFTSFVAYEYSGVKTGSNYHRNIVFRNAMVPVSPVSYLDAPEDYQLWQKLEQSCANELSGCDYLAIPHNPNLSNGKLLTPDYSSAAGTNEEKALAQLRQGAEPLMEIFQHKGQSECINGLRDINGERDPLCEFEQVREIGSSTIILDTALPTNECNGSNGDGGMIDTGCISRNDFLRGALLTGLGEEQRLGINPLKLGVIASTDTHESTPGAVDEQSWQGHVGRETTLPKRLQKKTGLPYRLDGNPGGLAGVWAVENSRDAIFNAMKRRETFGTSGPRIQPRFFAGWSFERDMCNDSKFVERGYEEGVPMGGDLEYPPAPDSNPKFAAAALRDPQGNLLQRLQIIKGWIDSGGNDHVQVVDIAGDTSDAGHDSLCQVYEDKNFNSKETSYYYLRVVENPSLRWSWAQCIALQEEARPVECNNDAPHTIQERAWTSAIWYRPPGS